MNGRKATPRPLASYTKTRKCITSCQQERPNYEVTYPAPTLLGTFFFCHRFWNICYGLFWVPTG